MNGIPILSWAASDREWLAARQAGLGASEVASALGIEGAYETPWQVWARKTGRLHAPTLDNAAVDLGNRLESWLIEQAQDLFNGDPSIPTVDVRRPSHRLYRSNRVPWMLASPDAFASTYGGPERVVECKTAGLVEPWAAQHWDGDDVPERVEVQAYWQRLVMGSHDTAYIAGLVAHHGLRLWSLPWDEEDAVAIYEQACQWWNRHVVDGEEPPVGARDNAVLTKVYANVTEGVAEIPDDLYSEYLTARAESKEAGDRYSEAKAAMKRVLAGRAEGRVSRGARVVTWYPNANGVRQLRVMGD